MSTNRLREFENAVEAGSVDEFLLTQIDPARLPSHIAIIMDGNGRWAARRNQPRVAGHRAGAEAVRATVEAAAQLGISYLTLYAFSTENWKRPRLEVEALMGLLREFLRKELRSIKRNNIRFQTIGREQGLGNAVSREIVEACRELARECLTVNRDPSQITEFDIEQHLFTKSLPDPDLLVRTSGELRVSNFLLWQIAYSEIYVTDVLWPDFRRVNLFEAILEFQKRERRYGDVKPAARSSLIAANMK